MTQLALQWMDEADSRRVVTHPPAPKARRRDPETSKQAAEKAADLARHHRAAIFGWLRDHPTGGTKDEIGAGIKLDATRVARRMKELRDTAGVYDSGETRKTPTGRAATVWKVRT